MVEWGWYRTAGLGLSSKKNIETHFARGLWNKQIWHIDSVNALTDTNKYYNL